MAAIAVGNVLDALSGEWPRSLVNETAYDDVSRLRGARRDGERERSRRGG